jgi:hypothetical protein
LVLQALILAVKRTKQEARLFELPELCNSSRNNQELSAGKPVAVLQMLHSKRHRRLQP